MYKQLLAHRTYVTKKLEQPLSDLKRRRLFKYHVKRVRDFQHERLVHLLVTFFFAGLFLASLIAWLSLPPAGFALPGTALVIVLFVLELAYIYHYFLLENGVQSLYELTEKIEQLR